MNLLKIQNDLRSAPDDALANYVANPQPHVPSYLALSELQRRQKMREEYQGQQGEQPSVAEEVIQKEQAPQGGLAAMMGGVQQQMPQQPQPVQTPQPTMMAQNPQQPTMMAEGGLASLPVDDDLFPEEFAGGGMVAFEEGGEVPSFEQGERVFGRELTEEEYNALSTRDKTAYDRQFFGKRFVRNLAKPFAAAADIVTSPYNMAINLAEKGLNAVDFARLGRTVGLYEPDVTSVKIPGTGSMTPYYDMIRRSEMVDTGKDTTGAKRQAVLPTKPAGMIAEENAAKIRSDIAAGVYDKKPKPSGPTAAPAVDVVAPRPTVQAQPERGIGDYAKELQDYLGTDPTRAESLARISKIEEEAARQKDIAPWMALAEAGFGMAAGSSPFALQNIGMGALRGVKAYGESNKDYQAQLEKANMLRNEVAKAERAEKVAIGKFGAESKEAQRERDFRERLQNEKIAVEYDIQQMQEKGALQRTREELASRERINRENIEAGRWEKRYGGGAGGLGGLKGDWTNKDIDKIREELREQARKSVMSSPQFARLGEKQRLLPQNVELINNAIEETLDKMVAKRLQGVAASRYGVSQNSPFGNMSYDALLELTRGTK